MIPFLERKYTKAGYVLIILSMIICLLAIREAPHGKRARMAALGRKFRVERPAMPDGSIAVNRADMEELMMLPGVGEILARAIIEEREKNGCYYFPEDLMAAKGIGPHRLEEIRSLLNLEGE